MPRRCPQIGNTHQFQNALNVTAFSFAPMQGYHCGVRSVLDQPGQQIGVRLEHGDVVSNGSKCVG